MVSKAGPGSVAGPTQSFFQNKRVLVTGGAGLIGSAFVAELLQLGARVRTVQRRRLVPFGKDIEVVVGDLRDGTTCRKACQGVDAVVHAAGVSGGSKQFALQPIPMFTDNLLMNTLMLDATCHAGVGYYLFLSNSSVYAPSDGLLREEDAWGESCRGIPENETGMVKRAGETQCALYARATDLRIAIMRAGNAYGPHDNFDLEASHVVPALVRKAVEQHDPYVVWGSGKTVRDFIHSRDVARGGLFLLERAVPGTRAPVNIATGETVTVAQLADLVLRLTGHTPRAVQFTDDAPPASLAKRMDITKMKTLGFQPRIALKEGLYATIQWYREACG